MLRDALALLDLHRRGRQARVALAVLGWASLPGMALAIAGASAGRANPAAPSAAWAAVAAGSLAGALLIWGAAWHLRRRGGRGVDWVGAGLPLLAAADGWIVTAFHYGHEPTNHLLATGLVTSELFARPSIAEWMSVKFIAAALLWAAWPRLSAPGARAAGGGLRGPLPRVLIVAAAVGGLAYLRLAVLDVLAIEVPSDLRANYVGALAMREGANPYDNSVALQVAGRERIPYVGTRLWAMVTNPPTAMLYFAPYTAMPLGAARLAFMAVSHLALLGTAWLTWRLVRPTLPPLVWLGLLLGAAALLDPFLLALRLGQVDLVIGLALAAAAYRLRNGDDIWGGACIGAAAALKLAPAVLALYLVQRRRWRALGGLALALAAAGALSAGLAGFETWQYYLAVRLPDLLGGSALFNNISLPGLILRVFMGPELAQGMLDAQPDIPLARALTALAVVAALAAAAAALGRRARQGRAFVLEYSLAVVTVLVVSSVTWPHYLAQLLPLLGLLLAPAWPTRAGRWAAVAGGLGLALAAFPLDAYSGLFGGVFDRSFTALSVRCLGLLTLFLALLLAVRTSRPAEPSAEAAA